MANSRFLPDFALIKWAGRDVIELPDHDATVRPDLRPHIYRMGKKLKDAGANVTVIELPDQGDGKSGADDYIKNEGIEAFLELERHSLDDGRYADLTGDALPSTFRLKNLPAEWLDKSPPPLEYVVDPLLPAQTVALLVAEGGAGKTFLSLRMAIDVATGQPFLGNPTTAGRVAYVALEDPPQVLQRRVHGIYKNQLRTLKPKAAERFRKQLRKRLSVQSLAGYQLHLVTLERGTAVQSATLLQLIARLRDQHFRLVILDPMSRLHGADENANATGTALVNAAERIAQDVGCTVVIAHHTGKLGSKRTDAYAARGASGIADAARVVLVLKVLDAEECRAITNVTPEEAQRGVLLLTHAKNNYAPRSKDIYLKRTDTGELERFEADLGAHDPDQMLKAFRAWHAKHGSVSYTLATQTKRKAMFGKSVSRGAAERWFKKAATDGVIVVDGKNSRGNSQVFKPSEDSERD